MQASWDMAAALIGIDGLADLLGKRHRIIANDWQAAHMNTLMSHLIDRAADILEQIGFTPRPCAPASPARKISAGRLCSAAELISHAADLCSESAGPVHGNERRQCGDQYRCRRDFWPWRHRPRPADGGGVSAGGIGQALRGLAQRLGGTHLGVLAIGRIVSPLQRQLYRRTGGRLSLTGRVPVLLLTTTGRRTGRARTVPLLYLRDGDRLVICNVNPGFERPNPWVVNLRAQPHAQVQIGHGTTSVNARPASDDELNRYWPQLTKMWPAYQVFYGNGGKRTVFVLEPDGLLPQVSGAQATRGTGPVRRHRTSGSEGDLDDRHRRNPVTGS